MQYDVNTVEQYLAALPQERKNVIEKLRHVIISNLPLGFQEEITYGMISYVVPLSRYPKGYHVKKGEPLPFLSLASQKNHVALYHFGIYMDKAVEEWFLQEYAKEAANKLDMGKSCIRFKNPERIPYDLIGRLCAKITVEAYISMYERALDH